MNIITKEIKNNSKSFLWWTLGYALLVIMMCFKMSALIGADANQQIEVLMASFPKVFRNMFGLDSIDLSTVEGAFSMMNLYMGLVATLFAAISGSNLFLKEEKTIEYLYVRPISRNKIFLAKFIVGLMYVVLFALVTYLVAILSSFLVFSYDVSKFALLLSVGLLLIMLIFYGLSLLLSVAFSSFKKGQSWAIIAVVATFVYYIILMTAQGTLIFDKLPKFLSPFYLYSAEAILLEGFNIVNIFNTLTFFIFAIIFSLVIHKNRDFR